MERSNQRNRRTDRPTRAATKRALRDRRYRDCATLKTTRTPFGPSFEGIVHVTLYRYR
jgi:hypothetical protein